MTMKARIRVADGGVHGRRYNSLWGMGVRRG